MPVGIEDYVKERKELNDIVLRYANKNIKRFYSLDSAAYREGSLPKKTKELFGLIASFVLRCNDCIDYHLIQCYQVGVTTKELIEALNVGLIVGGSITIPHLRHALKSWEELLQGANAQIHGDD